MSSTYKDTTLVTTDQGGLLLLFSSLFTERSPTSLGWETAPAWAVVP